MNTVDPVSYLINLNFSAQFGIIGTTASDMWGLGYVKTDTDSAIRI